MKVIQIMDNLRSKGVMYLSLDYYVRDMIQIQKSKILGMLELELNALAHRVKRGL